MASGDRTRALAAIGLLLGGAVFLISCTTVGDFLHGTRDRIVFSHKEHLDAKVKGHAAEQEMCAACHFATPKDIRGEEPIEPLEAQCLSCHKDWKTKNECGRCHTDTDKPLTYTHRSDKAKVSFSHARHNDRIERLEERACEYCHKSAWEEGPDRGALRLNQDPEDRWHETCFKCHVMRTEWERMNCAKCHEWDPLESTCRHASLSIL